MNTKRKNIDLQELSETVDAFGEIVDTRNDMALFCVALQEAGDQVDVYTNVTGMSDLIISGMVSTLIGFINNDNPEVFLMLREIVSQVEEQLEPGFVEDADMISSFEVEPITPVKKKYH